MRETQRQDKTRVSRRNFLIGGTAVTISFGQFSPARALGPVGAILIAGAAVKFLIKVPQLLKRLPTRRVYAYVKRTAQDTIEWVKVGYNRPEVQAPLKAMEIKTLFEGVRDLGVGAGKVIGYHITPKDGPPLAFGEILNAPLAVTSSKTLDGINLRISLVDARSKEEVDSTSFAITHLDKDVTEEYGNVDFDKVLPEGTYFMEFRLTRDGNLLQPMQRKRVHVIDSALVAPLNDLISRHA